jgi:hypothetical protein
MALMDSQCFVSLCRQLFEKALRQLQLPLIVPPDSHLAHCPDFLHLVEERLPNPNKSPKKDLKLLKLFL